MYLFDVALSFAGEDRQLVRQIADILRSNGVRVFYDEYERAELWGKELIEYLERVYKDESKYVMLFASKSYLDNEWTNHERKSALNRAFKEREEYILPIRLDSTKLPGLHDSIGYLNGRKLDANQICDIFFKKAGFERVSTLISSTKAYRFVKEKYAKDLSGLGASLYGGRWNNKGQKMLYAASNASLAYLQSIRHMPLDFPRKGFVMTQLNIPNEIKIDSIYETQLPDGWNNSINKSVQSFGVKWFRERKTCVLSLPSTFVPYDRIYLINPEHKDMRKITVTDVISEGVF